MKTLVRSNPVLDMPGLVECGMGGRWQRSTRTTVSYLQRAVCNKWVGGAIAGVISKLVAAPIANRWFS